MSVQSEITRLQGAKDDLAAAIEQKGVAVPAGAKLDDMAALVLQIETMSADEAFLAAHPVGSYLYTNGTDPNDVAGTWQALRGGMGPTAWLRTA